MVHRAFSDVNPIVHSEICAHIGRVLPCTKTHQGDTFVVPPVWNMLRLLKAHDYFA